MIAQQGPGAVALGAADRAAATAEVKALLRIASDDEDALIAGLAETALGVAEAYVGQVLLARSLRETLPVQRGWQRLAATPVTAITAVSAIAGAAVTPLVPGAFAIDIGANGDGWVRAQPPGVTQVAVDFAAGLHADWPALPPAIRQGVILLAAHLFDTRDGTAPPPTAVTAFWRPFRTMGLARRRRR